jgi:prepilin-type N-terminal cleavage/methylation domain-containing protein
MKPNNSGRKGFTLVEILVVIVIVVVLAALTIVFIQRARKSADLAVVVSNMRNVGVAALTFAAEKGRFPDRNGARGDNAWDRELIASMGYTGEMEDQRGELDMRKYADLAGIARTFSAPDDKVVRASENCYKRSFALTIWTSKYTDGSAHGRALSEFDEPARIGMVHQIYNSNSLLGKGNNYLHNRNPAADDAGDRHVIVLVDGHAETFSAKLPRDEYLERYQKSY